MSNIITPALHDICRWTVNTGEKGFTNAQRPLFGKEFTSLDFVHFVANNIKPNLPDTVGALGLEFHVDNELDEKTAPAIAQAMKDSGLYLGMITPGAHKHASYGGPASMDDTERKFCQELGKRTVDLAYGTMKDVWHPEHAPTLVIWNGSFAYDIMSPLVGAMYQRLLQSVEGLVNYEKGKGGQLYFGFEPKPNEGHGKMLLQNANDVVTFWQTLAMHDVDTKKCGSNLETGHSMINGSDPAQDLMTQLALGVAVHYHANSQGLSDGYTTGGPAMFDLDHGVQIEANMINIAKYMQQFGYNRWIGHDFQMRHHDSELQGTNRILQSICAFEACRYAAATLDTNALQQAALARDSFEIGQVMRGAVRVAEDRFKEIYKPVKTLKL